VSPLTLKLNDYLGLINAGCPVGRHELSDIEWLLLGAIKSEYERIALQKAKEKQHERPDDIS
jgi:hypothetical protein